VDDIMVIGEALVDIVSPRTGGDGGEGVEHPGGSPANVALGLARLARSTSLLTRIGDDPRGHLILDHLQASGVRIADGSVTDAPTSSATAVLDEDGIATYHFALYWNIPENVDVSGARALHTGSIAAFVSPGGDAVLEVVERSAGRCLVSYDPNARPQLMGEPSAARERVERIVASADVVKVSDEDVAWLAPGEDPVDVIRAWQASGPAVVVLTRGRAGATGVVAGRVVDVPAPPIRVVDTVGAGDAFMSGLLDAIAEARLLAADGVPALRELPSEALAGMLGHAVRVAAYTCTQAGAEPPTKEQLGAWSP
jgi:fructokinase